MRRNRAIERSTSFTRQLEVPWDIGDDQHLIHARVTTYLEFDYDARRTSYEHDITILGVEMADGTQSIRLDATSPTFARHLIQSLEDQVRIDVEQHLDSELCQRYREEA